MGGALELIPEAWDDMEDMVWVLLFCGGDGIVWLRPGGGAAPNIEEKAASRRSGGAWPTLGCLPLLRPCCDP